MNHRDPIAYASLPFMAIFLAVEWIMERFCDTSVPVIDPFDEE